MDAAAETPGAKYLSLLAGLESGTVGVLWMLLWMGISSLWQQRSFWAPENLMATAFQRDAAITAGFSVGMLQGLSLYLLIYSALGAVFVWIAADRLSPTRVLLVSVAFGLVWYYVSFHGIWTRVMPTVAALHVERSTMLGHLVYGTVLGRYPVYLSRLQGREKAEAPVENAVEEVAVTDSVATAVENNTTLGEADSSSRSSQDE